MAGLIPGCGGTSRSDEPITAKDKQRREAEANGTPVSSGTKWSRWRYTGERAECFFVVSGRCFKTEASACAAAKCGKRTCETTGGGPATVACANDH
jgi:hypothetical protein